MHLVRFLFGGELLSGQLRVELLLFFRYKLLVATGIDEGVGALIFHERIFFFQSEVTSVGTQENIAWQ